MGLPDVSGIVAVYGERRSARTRPCTGRVSEPALLIGAPWTLSLRPECPRTVERERA